MAIGDITGRVFGDLTVLELATKDKNNATIWKCQCVCGYTPQVRRYSAHRVMIHVEPGDKHSSHPDNQPE